MKKILQRFVYHWSSGHITGVMGLFILFGGLSLRDAGYSGWWTRGIVGLGLATLVAGAVLANLPEKTRGA